MGQARKIMDRLDEAMLADDFAALEQLYAPDVVAETPDEGRLEGRDAVIGWLRQFSESFSDIAFEMTSTADAGDTAIDEGYLSATHTGPMPGPQGEIAPSGKRIRVRECDVVTVKDGKVVSHRFYFDQLDLLAQLGVLEAPAIVLPDARRSSERAGAKTR